MTRNAAIGNIAGIILAAAAAVVSPAGLKAQVAANPGPEAPRSERVGYAGLDLGSERGRQELDRLIVRAARRVCEQDGTRELSIAMHERQCTRSAIAAARQRSASLIARDRLATAE